MKTILPYPGASHPITVYTAEEIDALAGVVAAVRDVWRSRCKAYVEKNGDQGTCVLGAGIACYVVEKGKRKHTDRMLIDASEVMAAQGASTWEESVYEMIQLLADGGLVGARYECGRMD